MKNYRIWHLGKLTSSLKISMAFWGSFNMWNMRITSGPNTNVENRRLSFCWWNLEHKRMFTARYEANFCNNVPQFEGNLKDSAHIDGYIFFWLFYYSIW